MVQSDYIQRAVWIGKGMVLSAYSTCMVWCGVVILRDVLCLFWNDIGRGPGVEQGKRI
jgi:hypothetical protein